MTVRSRGTHGQALRPGSGRPPSHPPRPLLALLPLVRRRLPRFLPDACPACGQRELLERRRRRGRGRAPRVWCDACRHTVS